MKFELRISQQKDLKRIVEIYNWAIENTTATFDTQIKSVESQQDWYREHSGDFPLIVATQQDSVIGWGCISRWSERCAYVGTGEVSFYVHSDYQGLGVGTQLLAELIRLGRIKQFRTLISRIGGQSAASIHLHKKLGFVDIGTMKNVGKKLDEILDVHLMQFLY